MTADIHLAHVANVEHTHLFTHCLVLGSDILILNRHVVACKR